MKKIFLIATVLILVFIVFVFFSLNKKQTTIQPSPTGSVQPAPLPKGALPNNYTGNKNADEANRRAYLVGQLINKLPIEETHLTLSYDFNKNVFTATIDSPDKNTGLLQLDAVLKTNGITSRAWIENLAIVYE